MLFCNRAAFPALVVKASGLAAGKGVVVAENKAAACVAVDEMLVDRKFGDAGSTIVIEELLEGEEVSVNTIHHNLFYLSWKYFACVYEKKHHLMKLTFGKFIVKLRPRLLFSVNCHLIILVCFLFFF